MSKMVVRAASLVSRWSCVWRGSLSLNSWTRSADASCLYSWLWLNFSLLFRLRSLVPRLWAVLSPMDALHRSSTVLQGQHAPRNWVGTVRVVLGVVLR